mgnify:CR=1 FL=1
MPVSLMLQSGTATVVVSGACTRELQHAFRECCEQALGDTECTHLDLDLSAIDCLDSSTLGVLLLVKEKAAGLSKPMRLLGVQGPALQHLQVARFDKLFRLV